MLDERMISAEETRRLRILIDRLPAMIGYWDHDLRNVIANAAYLEHFGMTPDEIRGKHIRDVLGNAVYALNLPYIESALAGQEQLFDRTLIDRHGATRHTEASYVPDIVDGEVRGFYVHVTDVTARVEAERVRDEALGLFQISMDNAPFGKALLTTWGRALQVNPALCQLIGYTAEELTGVDYRDYVHPDDVASGQAEFAMLIAGSVPQIASERRYIRRDGTTIWMQRNAVLVPGAAGADDIVVAQFHDVTARKHAEADLARLAITDPLTGLPNRHALVNRIDEHRAAQPAAPVGIVFVDLDGFKQVNDMHGHAAGDDVLIQATQRLSQNVAPPDSAYRLGGDEFVVLVPDAQAGAAVADRANAICAALTGIYDADGVPVSLAASLGWTWGQTADAEELICRADADMYRHKARRRGSGGPAGEDI